MTNLAFRTPWKLAVVASCFFCLAASAESRSTKLLCAERCASFQLSDTLPDQPAQGVIRLAVGGDARDDSAHVVPWAFSEARKRGATAFFFLGDLELTPAMDKRFLPKLTGLGNTPFYPVIGNHEIEAFGFLRHPQWESRKEVLKFKDEFHLATVPSVKLASGEHFLDTVVYSANLEGGVHLVALDNVSRRGEGFGPDQLAWLADDLKAAHNANKVILVGMHKPLAHNPVTAHAMDEDGAQAVEDSEKALKLFADNHVAMVFVSHSHMYAAYTQLGLPFRLTGGMGAPLVKGLDDGEGAFHHFLLVDVSRAGTTPDIRVEVVKFPCVAPCKPSRSERDESEPD